MEHDIYELWASLVRKHTNGGACNFQGAAIELAWLTEQKERESCTQLCDLALEQLNQTMQELGAHELMEQCVVQGAMNQAKRLKKSILLRNPA